MELRYCEKCGDVIPIEGQAAGAPTEKFFCPRCGGGPSSLLPPSTPAPAEKVPTETFFQTILDQSSMNLFSPNTVAIRRKEAMEKESQREGRLQLAEGSESSLEGLAGPGGTPVTGSSVPARTARKLQFRCLHCRATLMVRPVHKASRMVCPKCKGSLFIDQNGVVSKKPPTGSTRIPSGRPGSASVRPGSVRVAATPVDDDGPLVPPAPAPQAASAPEKPARGAGLLKVSPAAQKAAPPAAPAAKPPSVKVALKPPSARVQPRPPSVRLPAAAAEARSEVPGTMEEALTEGFEPFPRETAMAGALASAPAQHATVSPRPSTRIPSTVLAAREGPRVPLAAPPTLPSLEDLWVEDSEVEEEAQEPASSLKEAPAAAPRGSSPVTPVEDDLSEPEDLAEPHSFHRRKSDAFPERSTLSALEGAVSLGVLLRAAVLAAVVAAPLVAAAILDALSSSPSTGLGAESLERIGSTVVRGVEAVLRWLR